VGEEGQKKIKQSKGEEPQPHRATEKKLVDLITVQK